MSDKEEIKRDVLICECHSLEHQMVFHYEREWDEVSVSIHLNSPSFWGRLKYLFGYKSRFGAWDEILIRREKIQEVLTRISEEVNKEDV